MGGKLTSVFGAVLVTVVLAQPVAANPREGDSAEVAQLPLDSPHRLTVGLGFERSDDNLVGRSVFGDQLLGLIFTYRYAWAGVSTRLLFSPQIKRTELVDLRVVGGIELRVYPRWLDVEWSFGGGVSAELRLGEHFNLAYVTPFEVGVTIHQNSSLVIRGYTGVRYLVAGALLDLFLIDPNGLNDETAIRSLADEKDQPIEGFLRLEIARRVD